MATRRWSSKATWMRSGWLRGSIFWVLSFWVGFLFQKTIIPEAGSTFSSPQHAASLILSVDWGFGMSPPLRKDWLRRGMRYVLDVRPDMTVWPLEPTWTTRPYPGNGRPRKPRLPGGQKQTMQERAAAIPADGWREITVAGGQPGATHLPLQCPAGAGNSRRKPGEILWAVYRRNRDGSEPRYYLSNAPEDTPLETLAYVGGSRWRIETEFETEKSDLGLDGVRDPNLGRLAPPHHHVPAGGSLPADPAAGLGGKMPQITRPQVYRVLRELLPKERFGPCGTAGVAGRCPRAQ